MESCLKNDALAAYLSNRAYYRWLFDDYVAELKEEIPNFKLHVKEESKFMSRLGWYYTHFMRVKKTDWDMATVSLGYNIWMNGYLHGTKQGYMTLRHEAQHVRDWHNHRWIYLLSYIFSPYGPSLKAWLEYRGYVETMRVTMEEDGFVSDTFIDMIAEAFASRAYGFMFPFKGLMKKWLRAKRDEIEKELYGEDEAMSA